MQWLTLLLTLLPKLLEILKLFQKQEREAAIAGIDSPLSAAIKVLETTGDTAPLMAAVQAAEGQAARLGK